MKQAAGKTTPAARPKVLQHFSLLQFSTELSVSCARQLGRNKQKMEGQDDERKDNKACYDK